VFFKTKKNKEIPIMQKMQL